MAVKLERAAQIRDEIHNLDLNNPEHMKIYEARLYEFIKTNEGKHKKVYTDSKNKRTIGIGFNMDRDEARDEWDNVFHGTVSFDDAREGRIKLTDEQIDALFPCCLETRRKELRIIYGRAWKNGQIKPNERMAIEDAYFVGPALVGSKTKFYKNIKDYVKTSDLAYLKKAHREIKERSNPIADKIEDTPEAREKEALRRKGIQNRRDVQAKMLASYECPFYTQPHEGQFPQMPCKRVILGKTRIPREAPGPYIYHEDLYIWRTCKDNKVRSTHRDNEGKLFLKSSPPPTGNPGDAYNCRCQADHNIPAWINAEQPEQSQAPHEKAAIKFLGALENLQLVIESYG